MHMATKATVTTKDSNKLRALARCNDMSNHKATAKVPHLRTTQQTMEDIEQALRPAPLSDFQCIRMNLALTEIFLHAALQLSLMITVTVYLSANRLVPRTILAMLSHPANHLLL
jgi:hypothetical protein